MHRTLKQHTSCHRPRPSPSSRSVLIASATTSTISVLTRRLDQTPPAQHYRPSLRPWPARLEDPWYDADHQVRRVRSNGEIKWQGEKIFIGESLIGELVGIRQTHWGDWLVRFAYLPLALIDYRGLKLKALGAGEYPLPQTPTPNSNASNGCHPCLRFSCNLCLRLLNTPQVISNALAQTEIR